MPLVEGGGPRVARPVACGRCHGRGTVAAVACGGCLFIERVGGPAAVLYGPDLYLPGDGDGPERDGLDAFPCGHTGGRVALAAVCPACRGTGAGTAWKTEAAWAKRDARAAREAKQASSLTAAALHAAGPLWGQSQREWRSLIARLTPRCERRSLHTGQPCRLPVVLGRQRCRFHGGLSTGPKTEAGREAIRESNRRRSNRRRGSAGGGGTGPP